MTTEKDEACMWDCPKCPWQGGAEVEPSKTLDALVYPPAEKGVAR